MSRRESRYDDLEDEEEEVFDEFDDYEDDGFVVDDEEDEDDEEGDYARGPSSKKSKINRNIFIDDIAEDSEGEEEDYEDEEEDGFIEYDNNVAEPSTRQSYPMRPAFEEEESAEVLAARLHEKYSSFSAVEEDSAPQSELLPAPGDPMIWMIKCKVQREKDILVAVYRRYALRVDSLNPINITSAFYRDHQKGYLYFEANNVSDVQAAIAGIPDVYSGTLKLISRKEMVDVIQIKKRKVDLKKGDWCRVSRGKFAGDLCQVIDVSDNMESAVIKLVPRIELDDGSTAVGVGTVKKKGVVRPKQRLFDRKLVEAKTRGIVSKRGAYLLYEKDRYKDGFLEKEVKVTTLITQDVLPTVDELTMFAPPRAGNDSRGKIDAPNKRSVNVFELKKRFTIGDRVKVSLRGANAIGIIDNMDNDEIKIRPIMTVPIFNIRRHFEEGEHVKVISGLSQGESGIVIGIKGEKIRIVTDVNSKEIEVHANDIGGKAAKLDDKKQESPFRLYDFVQLDYQTVGLVIKLGLKYLKVIDQNGITKSVEAAITTPIHSKVKPFAMDSNRVPINIGDRVQMLKAENRFGVILQIHNSIAFVRYEGEGDDLGIRVEKADTLKSMVKTTSRAPAASRVKQEFKAPPADLSVPKPGQGGFRPGSKRRDPLIDKTVIIRAGSYKGYKGVVKEVFPDTVRIEMLGAARVVTVNKKSIDAFEHPYEQETGAAAGGSSAAGGAWGASSVRGGWGARTSTNNGGNQGVASNSSYAAPNSAWNRQSRQTDYNSTSTWRNDSIASTRGMSSTVSWGNKEGGSVSSRNTDRSDSAWSTYRSNQAAQARPEPSPWKSRANEDSRPGSSTWGGASSRAYPPTAPSALDSVAWGDASQPVGGDQGEWNKPVRKTSNDAAWNSSTRQSGAPTNQGSAWNAPNQANPTPSRNYRDEAPGSAPRGSGSVNWSNSVPSAASSVADSNWSSRGSRNQEKEPWSKAAETSNSVRNPSNDRWTANPSGNPTRTEATASNWEPSSHPTPSGDRTNFASDGTNPRAQNYPPRREPYTRDSRNSGPSGRSGDSYNPEARGDPSRRYNAPSNYAPRAPPPTNAWNQPSQSHPAPNELPSTNPNPWANAAPNPPPPPHPDTLPTWSRPNPNPSSQPAPWNSKANPKAGGDEGQSLNAPGATDPSGSWDKGSGAGKKVNEWNDSTSQKPW